MRQTNTKQHTFVKWKGKDYCSQMGFFLRIGICKLEIYIHPSLFWHHQIKSSGRLDVI